MSIRYLNTDLDLIAPFDLTPLAKALEDRGVFPLHVGGEEGRWDARFEVEMDYDGPEGTINAMLGAVEALGRRLRQMWRGCTLREFNIGYDCGAKPWGFDNGLSNQTLLRIGRVGGALRITLYPPEGRKKGS